jgi:hypothetical protein
MTKDQLRQMLWRKNTFNLVLGVLLLPGSLLLWLLSFWIFNVIYYIPLYWIGQFFWPRLDAASVSWYIALFCIIALAIDGLRYSRQLFDLHEFSQSSLGTSSLSTTSSGRIVNAAILGNPVGKAYFISQFLYLAPESTLQGIKALRSRLPEDAKTIRQATEIFNQLYRDRQWVARDSYVDRAAAVGVLERLRLIWTRNKNGFDEIRIPPTSSND